MVHPQCPGDADAAAAHRGRQGDGSRVLHCGARGAEGLRGLRQGAPFGRKWWGRFTKNMFFFWGELLWIACVYIYIYTVYIYIMYTYFYVMCDFVIISTFIYLFISILSYFVLSYPACQVICDRKCLFWSWIWIPHGDGSKLKTNLQTSAIRSTLKNTKKRFVQWFDPLF